MTALVTGHDEALAKWCAARIPAVGEYGFGNCKAVGVVSGNDPADLSAKMLAVIVYHEYMPHLGTCQISFAAASPKWATRQTVRTLLAVPFLQYKVRKVFTVTPSDNERALRLNAGLGFTREATLRHHYGKRRHAVIYSMMANEFRQKWGN